MRIYFLLLALLFSLGILAQQNSDQNLRANQILNYRGEIYFYFEKPVEVDISQLSKIISIDNVKNNKIFAYANKAQFNEFRSLNIDFALVDDFYSQTRAINMASIIGDMQNWDKYPTYQLYVEMMHKFAQDYPDYCRIDTIGISAGYDMLLLSLVISGNVNDLTQKPLFFWTGTMHGDETTGYIMLLRFADFLLSNYGSNTEVTNLLDNAVIFINPLANPDGTFYLHPDGSTVADSRRYNINEVDLNRNFPTLDLSPTTLEPEILAMIDYSNRYPFTMSVNTHGGAEVANYPWDFWTSEANPHPDDAWWRYVCNIYAESVMDNGPSGYFTGVSNTGYIEGGDWYAVSGGRQDYMMYFKNCREMCLELSNTKRLASEDLPAFWNYNKDAMLLYTQQVLFGVGGVITDSVTHEPLQAKVFISNHDKDNSHVFSRLPDGYYHRPIFQGNYNITFSADGYKSKTINVSVVNNQFFHLDVELGKLENYPPDAMFVISSTQNNCSPDVQFVNLSEASDDTEYTWYFGDGTTSNLKEPFHSYTSTGSFSVALVAENQMGRDSLMIENLIDIHPINSPNVQSASSCSGAASLNLIANGEGNILWFDEIDAVEPIHIGNSFTTPILSQSKTYYAQDKVMLTQHVGPQPNLNDSGDYNTDNANHYLVFDCYQPVKLKSVKVVANSSGIRTISLMQNADELQTINVFIPQGEQIVDLNFIIPVGNNFKLVCNGPAGLYRGFSGYFSGFGFPFSVNPYLSIKQSDDSDWWDDEKKYYPYFYDWELVVQECASVRQPVYAIITNEIPTAHFTFTNYFGTYQFVDNSQNASSWQWDFGDGSFSNQQNVTHIYLESNNYIVKLTAFNQCGSSLYSQEINVNLNSEINKLTDINIYPNPCSQFIMIENLTQGDIIEIYTASGQKLYNNECSSNTIFIDLIDFPASLYTIRIVSNLKVYNLKILKI